MSTCAIEAEMIASEATFTVYIRLVTLTNSTYSALAIGQRMPNRYLNPGKVNFDFYFTVSL